MPSDPTTQDLIVHAREAAHGHTHEEYRGWCTACLRLALADRLEEVEEEREALSQLVDGWLDDVPEDSPEPSDPEPEDETTLEEMLEQVAREKGEPWPPEPEDDPWEAIKGWEDRDAPDAFMDIRVALLDLRERVRDLTQIARDSHSRLSAMEERARNITHAYDIYRRVEALEGHADRGSEAVTALEERVDELEAVARLALRTRGALRDDLETIDDFTEALAERVERLEGGALVGGDINRLQALVETLRGGYALLNSRVSALEHETEQTERGP